MVDDSKVATFESYRRQMMAIAYRMLGSISEAEEMVQDTYIEWQCSAPPSLDNSKNWLMKVCSRKCLDALRKAYKSREEYIGPWLPEPVIPSLCPSLTVEPAEQSTPEGLAMQSETLTTAVLVLLEKLNPVERAVFLLHDVFGYSFTEVADFVDKSEAYCRKLAERARKFLSSNRPRFQEADKNSLAVMQNFFQALYAGDKMALKKCLAKDSEFWSDGGGKAVASQEVLFGPDAIAVFFIAVSRANRDVGIEFKSEYVTVNNRPGIVITKRAGNGLWDVETVFSFEFSEEKIARIFAVRNPDKFPTFEQVSLPVADITRH